MEEIKQKTDRYCFWLLSFSYCLRKKRYCGIFTAELLCSTHT